MSPLPRSVQQWAAASDVATLADGARGCMLSTGVTHSCRRLAAGTGVVSRSPLGTPARD